MDGSQPVQTGEMITVTDDSFNVNATCEYCTETELKLVQNLSIVIKGRSSITANFHIEKKKKKTQSLPSFSLSVMLYQFFVLANISLLSHLSLLHSPSLSLAGCLYLSSHPPWCFSPSLQSMWLLRCLSICSPRQAQRAGATL